ncbi:MAG TPA: hypothetical protein V6D06_01045 [Trichocoleus sp.]
MNLTIAQAALTQYDLPNAELTFLGQSQNTTFRVDTPSGDQFLLRLHYGIEAADDASQEVWRQPSAIESELLWLNAIAHDTDLVVPQPMQNRVGSWVTRVGVELNASISCSLLRWVEGRSLDGEPTAAQACQLGSLKLITRCFSRPLHRYKN